MKKILVIEDEPDMRRNLTTILRLEKFLPLPAENGSIGLELAKKERPDLILCDVMMPELDGYGVIAALRANASRKVTSFRRSGHAWNARHSRRSRNLSRILIPRGRLKGRSA